MHDTISKFEEKDKNTGRSIKDDHPQLDKLIIFGFCSASDPKNYTKPIPDYCKVVTRKYLYELLTESLDEESIILVRNKLRALSYFNEIYTLGDNASIRIMKQYIDRGAVNHNIRAEGSYDAMTNSLQQLSVFINTGKNSSGKYVCKPRAEFGNDEYTEYLDAVYRQVSCILEICNRVRKKIGHDQIDFTESEMMTIQGHKDRIIKLNEKLAIPTLINQT